MNHTRTVDYENLAKVNQSFTKEFSESFNETLARGWFILGSSVQKFEEEFAAYVGAKYCIGVASGLDALILSLKALDFKPGDEVIVPSNTYIATILSVLQLGLKPVLVEPDINTYNIDHTRIEAALTPRTRAIMDVHLYGKPCDMIPIVLIKNKYGIALI